MKFTVTMAGNRILLDTNVLLTATDPTRRGFLAAKAVLDEWSAKGLKLFTSGQIVREYLVVATRERARNGLGLDLPSSLTNVQAFLTRCSFLEETKHVSETLRQLVHDTNTSGKQIHDANVVATALVHGVGVILTDNRDDFARFSGSIEIRPLCPQEPTTL